MSFITADQWLEALRDAMVPKAGGDEGWKSVVELAELTGRGAVSIRAALSKLNSQGKLESSASTRLSLDGVMRRVPIYRIRGD